MAYWGRWISVQVHIEEKRDRGRWRERRRPTVAVGELESPLPHGFCWFETRVITPILIGHFFFASITVKLATLWIRQKNFAQSKRGDSPCFKWIEAPQPGGGEEEFRPSISHYWPPPFHFSPLPPSLPFPLSSSMVQSSKDLHSPPMATTSIFVGLPSLPPPLFSSPVLTLPCFHFSADSDLIRPGRGCTNPYRRSPADRTGSSSELVNLGTPRST